LTIVVYQVNESFLTSVENWCIPLYLNNFVCKADVHLSACASVAQKTARNNYEADENDGPHHALLQKMFASWSLYGISCVFVKLSLLLLYLRLFDVDRPTRSLLLGGIVCVTVFYMASVAALLAPTVPWLRRGNLLDFYNHVGRHDDRILMAMSVFGAVSDAFLLLVPLRLVWRLHMPLRKKIGVSVLFLTGMW
jgi:hypothetical protein